MHSKFNSNIRRLWKKIMTFLGFPERKHSDYMSKQNCCSPCDACSVDRKAAKSFRTAWKSLGNFSISLCNVYLQSKVWTNALLPKCVRSLVMEGQNQKNHVNVVMFDLGIAIIIINLQIRIPCQLSFPVCKQQLKWIRGYRVQYYT